MAMVSLLSRLRAMREGSPSSAISEIRLAIRTPAVSSAGVSLSHSSISPSVATAGGASTACRDLYVYEWRVLPAKSTVAAGVLGGEEFNIRYFTACLHQFCD